jgi:acyl-CoA thioesterase
MRSRSDVDGSPSPFPDGPVGEHLAWYFSVRERGEASAGEIDAQFADTYRWGWGSPREPTALEAWFSRWRTLSARIEAVEPIAPLEFVVVSRLDNGVVTRVWFELEPDAPHRILRTRTTEQAPSEPAVDFAEASAFDPSTTTASIPPAFTTTVGPFGGYVAALALRAGGAVGASAKPFPLTLSGSFVSVGRSGPVTAEVDVLRSSSRLESSAVRLRQGETLLFSGHVWSASTVEARPSHAPVCEPLTAAVAAGPPEGGVAQGVLGEALEAAWLSVEGFDGAAWVRLRPRSTFDDPWTDAARLLLPIDWLGVGAGVGPYREVNGGLAVGSTLELTASFVSQEPASEWVLCAAVATRAVGPFSTAHVTVLSEAGRLLAQSDLQLLVRG